MTEPYSLAAQKSGLGYRILRAIKRDKLLFLMFLPIFAYYIIFNYIPMTGAIISFKQFRPGGRDLQWRLGGTKMVHSVF